MSDARLSIAYAHEGLHDRAAVIAHAYDLTLNGSCAHQHLWLGDTHLELRAPGMAPLWIDFNAVFHQRDRFLGRGKALLKACKLTPGMQVVDATAGWGRDAAVMAVMGAEVVMVERQGFMAALLADGLQRLEPAVASRVRLFLHYGSAQDYLAGLARAAWPDLICVDPMHPERQKSALVKKDLQLLQQLIGPDDDAASLIQCARAHVKKRVVVKWPQKLAPLVPPDGQINGKTVRFDIYGPLVG